MKLKFRAWLNESMYYNHSVSISIGGEVFFLQTIGEWVEDVDGLVKLMQFTGLKDKNGKEIYEGDIIRIVNAKSHIQKKSILSVIGFDHASFCALWRKTEEWEGYNVPPSSLLFLNCIEKEFMEVIGNIHENHELISLPPAC